MNDRRLQIYLDDHLALIVGEMELAARCRRSNAEGPLGDFLAQLERDLTAQQMVVKEVLRQVVGADGVESLLKQGAAWFAEKLGRFKLNDALLAYSSLSRVVELETLAAAAQERVALWDSLAALVAADDRLDKFDFVGLRDQARSHLADLDIRRRQAAVEAFSSD